MEHICKLNKSFLLSLLAMFWLDLCSSLTLQRREQKQSWHILLNLPNKNNLWVTEVLHVQTGERRDLANQYLLVLTRAGEWVGRKEPWAGSSEGVTLLPRTWHPSVAEGWVNTISISLVGDDLPKITNQSMSWVKHISFVASLLMKFPEAKIKKPRNNQPMSLKVLLCELVMVLKMCWMQACCSGYPAAVVYEESWGLGLVFIAWISASFVVVTNCWTSPCQLQQLPKYCFSRKALFDTVLASCCTSITESEEKIQHCVKSQFSMAQWRCSMGHIQKQLLAHFYRVIS